MKFQGLSLLKRNINANATQSDVTIEMKKTPFALMRTKSALNPSPTKLLDLQDNTSIRKFLDSAAYTLAPIQQIAPIFIKSCLAKKKMEI